jgi:DNA-binding Lrp family transcriptional regulator
MNHLDHIDLRLLTELQQDAQLTSERLGERLNLSASQVGRRRQRLEAEGYIEGYRARLAADRLGLAVQAFVSVQMATHAPDKVATFTRVVETTREIVSAWTLTGEADYLLRVYCADLSALNTLIHGILLPHPAVARVQSQIVMNQFKVDAPLPV